MHLDYDAEEAPFVPGRNHAVVYGNEVASMSRKRVRRRNNVNGQMS